MEDLGRSQRLPDINPVIRKSAGILAQAVAFGKLGKVLLQKTAQRAPSFRGVVNAPVVS
jgi:hypothetical protein